MPPPPVPLATFVADLQAPGVTLADAEQLLVELIDQRRLEGAERYRLGKELEILVREMPAHLVPALTAAKERSLLAGSYLSPAAFALASSRAQVVRFLRDAGAANPALAREVLLEYVAKKEAVVQGWPGGVRAAVEVVQGALRDVGVEVGHLPIASAVESVQLETGHVSIAALMHFLRTLAPAATVVGGAKATRAAGAAAADALAKGERALVRWAEVSLLNGTGRWQLRMELNEIQSQLPVVLQPIFPPLHTTLHLPPTPISPEALGLACIPNQIVPAFQRRSDPDFVREVLMEWVGWERRRCLNVWGRKRRGEMGLKLVEMEDVVVEKLGLGHLSAVFQIVRFHCNCPPLHRPTSPKLEAFARLKSLAAQREAPQAPPPTAAVDAADAGPLKPYNIAAILSLVPRALTDGEVAAMLDKYVGEERRKALAKGKGAATAEGEGEWADADRKRVADVLSAMVEKLNDSSVTPLFEAAMGRWNLSGQQQDGAPEVLNLAIAQGFLSPSSSVYGHDSVGPQPQPVDLLTPATSAFASPAASVNASPAASPKASIAPLPDSPTKSRVPVGVVGPPSPSANRTSDASAAWTPPAVDVPAPADDTAPATPPTPSGMPDEEAAAPAKKRGLFGTLFGGAPKATPKPVKPPKRRPGAVPQSTSRRRSTVISASPSAESLTLADALKSAPPSQPPLPRTSVHAAPAALAANRSHSMYEPSTATDSMASLALASRPGLHQRSSTSAAFPPRPIDLSAPVEIPDASTNSTAPSESSGSPTLSLSPDAARRPRVLKKRSSSASTSSRNSRASIVPAAVDGGVPALPSNALSKAERAKAEKASKAQKKADEKAAKKASSKAGSAVAPAVAVDAPSPVAEAAAPAPVVSQPFAMRSTPDVSHLRPMSLAAGDTAQDVLNAQAERRERRRSMIELGTFPDDAAAASTTGKKRFSIFGTWSAKKRGAHDGSPEQSYRPTSEIILDDSNFPPWTLPPPHQMGSPPKHFLALSPSGSPSSSPIDGPWNRRNSWRISTASFGGSGGGGGTSTPPIQEVDGEQGSPGQDRRSSPLSSSTPAEMANYLGQQLFEREPVGLGLFGPLTSTPDATAGSTSTRPSPAPESTQDSPPRRRMPSSGSSFRVSNPDMPSRRTSSVSFNLGPTAEEPSSSALPVPALPLSILASPPQAAQPLGPVAASALVETHSAIVRQIQADIMQPLAKDDSAPIDGLPSTSVDVAGIAAPAPPLAPAAVESSVTALSSPPSPVAASSSAGQRIAEVVPDTTSPAVAELASKAAESILTSPPVLSLRGVFDALPPGHAYSSGHVLDILIGFIDREREKALAFDRKRGWGEPQREKVGWFLAELEESLLPDNPHLTTTFQRVKALTDCPPQTKSKPKRHQSLSSRSHRRQSSTSAAAAVPDSPSAPWCASPAQSLSSATTSYKTDTDAESFVSDSSADSAASDATVSLDTATPASLAGRDLTTIDLEGPLGGLVQAREVRAHADTSTPRASVFLPTGEDFPSPSRSNTISGDESASRGSLASPRSALDTSLGLAGALPSPPMTGSDAPPPPYERARTLAA